MSRKADKKKKERAKRVVQQKLAAAARRRDQAKNEDTESKGPRARQVLTGAVKNKAQVTSAKPTVTHRRTGG